MRALLAFCIGLAACAGPLHADDDAKKKAELKWARGVADDFLGAAKRGDKAGVEALLAGEYAKLLTERDVFKSPPAEVMAEKTGGFEKATISAEDISPDQDEAVFKGVLESKSGTRAFTLRVVKGKDAGRWRVGFVAVEDEKPHPKPEPKK